MRERVERLLGTVLDDPKDPFRISELSVDLVRAEPARLADEARSLCLLGGRRVVRLRQASDQATAACRALLALERIEALVIIDAGELASGSSLRRLIEGARHAAAIACYRDEGRDLAAFVDRELAERHLRADADARAWLLEHVGADRGVTRAELDKLALYLGAGTRRRGRRAPGQPRRRRRRGRRQRRARPRRSGARRGARSARGDRALPRAPARRGPAAGPPGAGAGQPFRPPAPARGARSRAASRRRR